MKYKIGDVVQCIEKEREQCGFKVGHTYTIVAIDDDDDFVRLDNLKWWDTYGYPADFKLLEKTAMKKQFIDVEKYALENEIPLSVAHAEIQTWLFKEGYEWAGYGKHTGFINSHFLELNMDKPNCITWENSYCDITNVYEGELMFSRQVALTPFYNKIDKTEYVEFNGKQYDKKKLEEALAMIESAT